MKNLLGKWKQHLFLSQDPLTVNYIPEAAIYSQDQLLDFLNRFNYVYVKHDSTGQGRAIFKIYKKDHNSFHFNGYTVQGERIEKSIKSIDEFHRVLHPFLQFGRLSGTYIIQEGINSVTSHGQPFIIRVHTQILNNKWVVGGMYGNLGLKEAYNTGIVNSHRGSKVLSVHDLLIIHLKMNKERKNEVITALHDISIQASKVIAAHFPRREYGIDFGINTNGEIVLFEVNTTPGIGGFAEIENKEPWKRIVHNRKLQKQIKPDI
ncbi:YheC/YheD family protein [Bacillus sp. S/N-304-OC-R1]|uniref:YheC/YheD family protein n=1 Tax=Bacillus sp. S/N-304-OC-R1 TaxID=2758034 RepID=UPI001C8DC716|nr:YheC/YheD family protein [Bacillus sp. S/N-304-OC-R1]MBY0121277.1 YheC/YheD family protein [Bacillus sp. S/N-304-OC-R1]